MPSILLIDDDADLRDEVSEGLVARGHAVECLDEPKKGLKQLAAGQFDIVLLDNRMPGMTGIEFLEAIDAGGLDVPVILMTGAHSSLTAIRATKLRAVYVIKPDTHPALVRELLPVIERVLEAGRQPKAGVDPRPAPGTPDEPELVGRSKPMLEVYDRIGLFADSGDTVLILGESGTGKDLVARAIHNASPRKDGPFIVVHCGALNENLLESELFGHEKGAFTGADKRHIGRFEQAHQGTLFLDEIGDVPMSMQIKLLRVLQRREFERAGGSELVKVDVRVLAATWRDLPRMVREEKFRLDLFFRLDGVTIRVPPLRERLDDLPELVNVFVARAAAEAGWSRPDVAKETLERLLAHPNRWAGNVRDLENVIGRAVRLSRGSPVLLPEHIDFQTPAAEVANATPAPTAESEALAGLRKAIEWAWANKQPEVWAELQKMLEEELVRFAHTAVGGNQTDAAKRLGMGRTKVVELIKNLGLR